MASRHGLGRGLAALLTSPDHAAGEATLIDLPVEVIDPNPRQPRKDFDNKSLDELAESFKRSGILHPVVVRRRGPDRYELIVGERRWRAAQRAGLRTIPAMVREVSDAESLELALVENLLREDLNPIEEAEAYQRLLAEFGWSQEEVAERIGKDRSTVANCLRLLRLPEQIQGDLRTGRLTMGHARALLALSSTAEQMKLRDEILAHSWSVRATEEGVQRRRGVRGPRSPRRSADLMAIEDGLRRSLATRVRIVGGEHRGRIEVVYATREELDRLVEQLGGVRGTR
jgi:ParB family transcriptional regulator, chromosome partitioning protein